MAELGLLGFESFEETDTGISAYIQDGDFDPNQITEIPIMNTSEFKIRYTLEKIPSSNWNAVWEQDFKPIVVDDTCAIRASFHQSFDLPFEIIIDPKMSFGTGHHETTHMMVQMLLPLDIIGRRVLDMGAGTGVLAILASKKGASEVDAIDYDEWCYANCLENIASNEVQNVNVHLGSSEHIKGPYHTVLANINRNVLLEQIPVYASALSEQGTLILSGFYERDIPYIEASALAHGLVLKEKIVKNDWVCLKFIN